MPSMANIVVKDASNVDFTLSALSASAGDKVPARWRADANGFEAVPAGLRPQFEVVSQDNGPKTARRVTVKGFHTAVYTNASTGLVGLTAKVPFSFEIVLPTNIGSADVAQASTIAANFVASTLMKSVYSTGYAPT